ncbi:MAG: DUF4221 domain-containing protein [Mongoliibacter sp.]|uniref:DUF4221 family protein n=1 Tax=Mongoliibacter sp. TaxID=2022438 RepID=UPI0012F3691E|nr:DUF4221 family protein [Mongoliibacter sp.]TVP48656.1 MAG: DUF4221 domain-containing protein [Mongoliibacter sp.]
MKKLIFGLSAIFLAACGGNDGKESGNIYQDLTISMDTVMVDAGEDFLYLRENLWLSDISADGRYLFNFNRNDAVLEKIDLDRLVLDKKIKFEKEGPNGIGTFISNFSITSEEQIMIWSYGLSAVFDQGGQLVKNLNLDKITADEIKESDAFLMALYENPNDKNRYVGFYIKWEDRSYFLLDLDIDKETYKKIELPELKNLDDYAVELMYEGQFVGAFGTGTHSLDAGNIIVVSNLVFNEAYIHDFSSGGLMFKSWDGPLIGSKKTYIPPKQVDFQSSQHWEVSKKIDEDINYGKMLWDPKNERYLRFSTMEKFGDDKEENGAFKPIGANVFLSVFDKDFNLVAESLVPNLNKKPLKHFVKDGQIWIFENMDDELAFLKLSVE